MELRSMSPSLSVNGERDERKSHARNEISSNKDKENSKAKEYRIEVIEKSHVQRQAKRRTEPAGQSHGSCTPSTGSVSMEKSLQSATSRKTRIQFRQSKEIKENLINGLRGRQARAYFRKPFPALCSEKTALSFEEGNAQSLTEDAQSSCWIEGHAGQDGCKLVLNANRGKTHSDATRTG